MQHSSPEPRRHRRNRRTPSLSKHIITAVILPTIFSVVWALDNGVGQTPAMGWNSWNYFRCEINETIIKEVADAIVSSGLRDAGYVYVNIDDCWMEKRDQDGVIQPFKNKFPNGMKAVADYIHSLGLKFGLYSDTGNQTCEGYPGSWGWEQLDAKTYAEWGVDYLKYDYCGMDKVQEPTQTSYERMRDALLATKRPILYSICSWGAGQPWKWGPKVGNSWRVSIDTFAAWDAAQAAQLKLPNFLEPVMSALKAMETLHSFAGPGGFNDPDMLVVGLDGMYPYGIVKECPEHVAGCQPGDYISRERWGKVGGLTITEQRTHFAFWCMLSSPLILGNDPRHMTQATLDILTAPQLVAINQDTLAIQGKKVWSQGDLSIWVKPLKGDRIAAILFNAGRDARSITMEFKRDLPEHSRTWEREVLGSDPDCKDLHEGCANWAGNGECKRNPGFMLDQCKTSCPEGCRRPLGPAGPKATALVIDAWTEEELGPHLAVVTAHLVEPHEARVLILEFVELSVAAAWRPKVTAVSRVSVAKQRQDLQAVAEELEALKKAAAAVSPPPPPSTPPSPPPPKPTEELPPRTSVIHVSMSDEDLDKMVELRVKARLVAQMAETKKLETKLSHAHTEIHELEALSEALTVQLSKYKAQERVAVSSGPPVTVPTPLLVGGGLMAALLFVVGVLLLRPAQRLAKKPVLDALWSVKALDD